MDNTFFFYDLETTGLSAREARIMQFAGQRTDLDMNPVGEPENHLIKQTEDILPEPSAIMVTGITPQKTLAEGITEDAFIKIFNQQISKPGTIFIGYNNISFDDEFMRFLLYRNLYDSYEWQWRDQRSKWDLLDVIRMTRALRPEGVNWPNDKDNVSTNRLEILAKANNISHLKAHDAMSDVEALIALAKLLKEKQPKLFSYLLDMRDKNKVADFVLKNPKFVHVSGGYSIDNEKASIVTVIPNSQTKQGVMIYDLTKDPSIYENMSASEIVEVWKYNKDEPDNRLPVKNLQFNRCPAIAPTAVLLPEDWKRLKLEKTTIDKNYTKLLSMNGFLEKILEARDLLDNQRSDDQNKYKANFEANLYNGFIGDQDKRVMAQVHQTAYDYSKMPNFLDERLVKIYPLYVARNYPEQKNDEINEIWQKHQHDYFYSDGDNSRASQYYKKLEEIAKNPKTTKEQLFILEELKLWAEAIMPSGDDF